MLKIQSQPRMSARRPDWIGALLIGALAIDCTGPGPPQAAPVSPTLRTTKTLTGAP